MNHRTEAQRLLRHYIRLVMEASGLKPDGDTDAELDALVDHLIEAARAPETAHSRELRRKADQ